MDHPDVAGVAEGNIGTILYAKGDLNGALITPSAHSKSFRVSTDLTISPQVAAANVEAIRRRLAK